MLSYLYTSNLSVQNMCFCVIVVPAPTGFINSRKICTSWFVCLYAYQLLYTYCNMDDANTGCK